MRKYLTVIYLTTILPFFSLAVVNYNKVFDLLGKIPGFAILIALFLMIVFTLRKLISVDESINTYRPYNVAIIGFPRSGKTTLIISLFEEIFNRKIQGIKATIKGESTIDRINELLAKKQSGLPVGPTNDQTMFAYRTNIETHSLFFKREYKVEFGDYPGEYSEHLTDNDYYNELKKAEFFKWCMEANAYIFVIDVGRYLLTKEKNRFIASSSKTIRQSWQHFVDNNYIIESKQRSKPVLLIFNKIDLCMFDDLYIRMYYDDVNELAFSNKKTPVTGNIDVKLLSKFEKTLNEDFKDIISFLESNCNKFQVLYTSSFGKIDDNYIGIQKILKFVFPYGKSTKKRTPFFSLFKLRK